MTDEKLTSKQFNDATPAGITAVTDAINAMFKGAFGYSTTMVANEKQDADYKAGKPIIFEIGNSEGHEGFEMRLTEQQLKNLQDAMKHNPDFCNKVVFNDGSGRDDFHVRENDNGFGPTINIENGAYFTKSQLAALEKRSGVIMDLINNGLDSAMTVAQKAGLTAAPSPAKALGVGAPQ